MEQNQYRQIFVRQESRFVADWIDFLKFKSISTDPAFSSDCHRCAEWLRSRIEHLGFHAELWPTATKPVVYGMRQGKPGRPTVLYYGHYDVQPVDPLALWESDPFTPVRKGDRVYARGALDNKGQSTYFLKAVETLLGQNALDCTLKVLIEGEEECGSAGLKAGLGAWREKLKADVLMVCDSEMHSPGVPAVTMGFRGIVHLNLAVRGPKKDLHSGLHGGLAPNPAQALVRMIASLHDSNGAIAVKGFYDSIEPLKDEERKLALSAPFNEERYRTTTGVAAVGGERGLSPQERRGLRPTIELNGIHSGYGGPGHKTIIPSVAEAKLTSRIVMGQDPDAVLRLIEDHLRTQVPQGLTLEFTESGAEAPAVSLKANSPLIKRAAGVLERALNNPPVYIWEGASVPIVSGLVETSDAEPLLVGFGLPEDAIHAPNESFSLTQFREGFTYAGMMLEELGRV